VRKSFASTASPADAVGVCRPRGLQTTVLRAARRSAWTPVWANRGRCCWSRPVLGTWRNAYLVAGSAAPGGPGAFRAAAPWPDQPPAAATVAIRERVRRSLDLRLSVMSTSTAAWLYRWHPGGSTTWSRRVRPPDV